MRQIPITIMLFFVLASGSANAARRPLTRPPKAFETYAKVSGLWQGNKLMYCNPGKAIEQTIKEVKQLNEVKTASFDAGASEIKIETRSGERGSIDVDNAPKHKQGELCLE